MAKPKYQDDFPARVEEMAEKGLIERDMAHNLGVSVTTFEAWKTDKIEFFKALKRGKAVIDERVEIAGLLKRALGYPYEERKTEEFEVTTKDGKIRKVKRITTTEKRMAPDTTACIFWLKNRRPHIWRDVYDHTMRHSNKLADRMAETLSDDELRAVAFPENGENNAK